MSIISFSGMAQWQLSMQEGGNIYTLVEQDNVMFAGALDGIYKSNDGGDSWSKINNGLTSTMVHAMLVNNSRLFAGTEAGVFISDDGGDNWIESNQGLTISKINSFVLTNTGIFAGTEDEGVFYSTDNGANWVSKNTGLSNLSVKTMISNNNRLFAGTDGAGVYYSDNLGASWTQSNNGLSSWFISHLTVKDNKLFVSTAYKFCISENNGLDWDVLDTPFDHNVLCSVNYNGYLFVGTNGDGVGFTTDYGQTWTVWNDGLPNNNIYSINIFNNKVWAACCCGFGLFKRSPSELTSLEQINNNYKVSVFPNPANNVLNIEHDIKIDEIRIVNMFGSVIKIYNIEDSSSNKLNIQGLKEGVYFLEMQTKKGILIKKIIVQY